VFLQAQSQHLLRHDMTWFRWCDDRLDPAARPEQQQSGGRQQATLVQGEEEAVARRSSASARTAQPLQKGRYGSRHVDLDDPGQVTYIDTEFQRAGGDDDTVACLGECFLRTPSLSHRKRGVRQERGHTLGPQTLTEFLDLSA
jgi:hypothetical protein